MSRRSHRGTTTLGAGQPLVAAAGDVRVTAATLGTCSATACTCEVSKLVEYGAYCRVLIGQLVVPPEARSQVPVRSVQVLARRGKAQRGQQDRVPPPALVPAARRCPVPSMCPTSP